MTRKTTSKNKTKRDHQNGQSLSQVLKDFCRNTSAHGFHYWVSAGSYIERLFWVAVVMSGFVIASTMVSSVITHWNNHPTDVAVKTFSMPAGGVEYPAITICNQNGYDTTEYLRAVFDNFQYACDGEDCKDSELLRSHFRTYHKLLFVGLNVPTELLDRVKVSLMFCSTNRRVLLIVIIFLESSGNISALSKPLKS